MEIIKQPVFFEPTLKIKKCHRDNCSGDLNTSEMFLWKTSSRRIRYSCKKCVLCGTIYLDCELYYTIKNKEQLEILNHDIDEVKQSIEKRREKKLKKKIGELGLVDSSQNLEDKRYIGTSMERSFIQININKLKKR